MFANPVRILLAVLGLTGAIAVVLAVSAGVKAFNRMKADAAAYADCRAVAGLTGRKSAEPPLCDGQLAESIVRAVKAEACDQALGRGAAGAFAASQACSAPVKHLVADRDGARRDLVDRDQLVDQLKAERSADVARAEARGQTQARRATHATRVLDAAPRDDRGRIACDADCLSVLAGDTP